MLFRFGKTTSNLEEMRNTVKEANANLKNAPAEAPVTRSPAAKQSGPLVTDQSIMDKMFGPAEGYGPSKPDYGPSLTDKLFGFGVKKGGKIEKYAKGGHVKSAHHRGDGIATKGHTKGRHI